MDGQNFSFKRVILFSILFFAFTIALNGQEISVHNNDSAFYSGIKKEYAKGMSFTDFLQTCLIRWNPVDTDSAKWEPIGVDISKKIRYSEFDKIISKLAASSAVKAYTASITSEDGRPIYCLEIGNGSKTVTFTAGVHAREVANPQFMLKFASELVSEYEKGDTAIADLLSTVKLVVLPCVNPDGYEAATNGTGVIANKKLYFATCNNCEVFQTKSNARGVDLNRNFPSFSASLLWKEKKEDTYFIKTYRNSHYFAGDTLGSEKETRVTMNFLMKYIPVSFRYVDFHSVGRCIYAGKPHLSDQFNNACLKTGALISSITKYDLLELDEENTGEGTDGSITDFAAEVAAGFVYNPVIGRLAPTDSVHNVRKTEMFNYQCSVNTVETLNSLVKDKKSNSLEVSTPQMHVNEWEKYHLYHLFLTLLKE